MLNVDMGVMLHTFDGGVFCCDRGHISDIGYCKGYTGVPGREGD